MNPASPSSTVAAAATDHAPAAAASSSEAANPGPQNLDPNVVRQAARWMARLWSDTANDADDVACARWRAAHPDHERAWRTLQSLEGKLSAIPPDIARHALREPSIKSRGRRRVLGMAALAAAGGALVLRESGAWQRATSDYATGRGEIRSVILPDGTAVVLDTVSAFDAVFGATARMLVLHAGRILVATARDSRPFSVRTVYGDATAQGTRFSVALSDQQAHVAVLEGVVSVRPVLAPAASVRLHASQRAAYWAAGVAGPEAALEDAAWTRGRLAAVNMRLGEFAQTLSRYRAGRLRCDPAVANLRVSGVFPLRDTDRALHALTQVLPVTVRYRSPYWVTIVPR
ncbi:FecR domain-containing protein [Paracandidimonas lactea]|uniref:FecR domain-containing protein n=1 Tax=Paracandidimonas lactea TaxID=2895524 RepID=UPI001EF1091C|nr:FecR domain-containing protein [Paracandidimonas lactea]